MLILSEADRQAILHIHHQWLQAEIAGHSLDVLQLCTADVRWLVPHSEMMVGHDAARSLLVQPGLQILDIATAGIDIQGSDRLAYKTCRYRTTFTTTYEGDQQVATGTHLWILHKQTDDQWRVALVTWQAAT